MADEEKAEVVAAVAEPEPVVEKTEPVETEQTKETTEAQDDKKHTLPKIPSSKYYPKFVEKLPEQKDRVVVITGTTSGTGNVAARTSLKKGAITVMLNRNEAKARKSLAAFFEEFPETEERAVFIHCDLQDFETVRKAAEEVTEQFKDQGINVLCNNAGVMALEDKATKDGYDVQMQTNHLSHFLLTSLLFPLLEKAAEKIGEARVVNHSSGARMFPVTTLKKKYLEKRGGNLGGNGNGMLNGARWHRYHQTKLANCVFTTEMQSKCKKAKSKVIALCAHPGLAATELQVTTSKDGGLKGLGFMSGAQSPEDGAMGILRGMFAAKVTKGALYGPRTFTGRATHRWYGMPWFFSSGKMLWKKSEEACGEFKIEKKV